MSVAVVDAASPSSNSCAPHRGRIRCRRRLHIYRIHFRFLYGHAVKRTVEAPRKPQRDRQSASLRPSALRPRESRRYALSLGTTVPPSSIMESTSS